MEEEKEKEEEKEQVFKGKALSNAQRPYECTLFGRWQLLKLYYRRHPNEVVGQLTTNNDTVLHVVAFAGRYDVLHSLISLIPTRMLGHALITENSHGNTILHEVAASGNLDAAKLLMLKDNEAKQHDPSYAGILAIPNKLGETPLYRAAAFGHTNLVKYLASEVQHQQQDLERQQQQDIEDHFKRYHDKISILHIAIIGQHFETALWLLKMYQDLANRKESNGLTSLQLLAQMPTAFELKFRRSIWKMLIYKYISADDLESRINQPSQSSCSKNITRWRPIRHMLDEMKNKKCLSILTRLLVEQDYSWAADTKTQVTTFTLIYSKKPNETEEDAHICDCDKETSKYTLKHNPLLIATCKGISKIVKYMLISHPQAVEAHDPETQQNILHMAIKYRRLAIFKILENSELMTSKLAYMIDIDGNTILHHAAHMSSDFVDAHRVNGPAFQLQEELLWLERVQKIMPTHYAMHQNNQGLTAKELFECEHAKLLKSAKVWIKGTAQSCSTVAALVATVAYAAAFTAPGGNDDNGVPVLRHSPFFAAFTVSDTVSLICSLTSLGTFLSILTSPFEYENFHRSLPCRLHLGFALLFFSLVATMLTFTATLVLLIHHQRTWTTSLIYVVALLPVSVFGLSQFPLYDGFLQCVRMKPVRYSIGLVFLVIRYYIRRVLALVTRRGSIIE